MNMVELQEHLQNLTGCEISQVLLAKSINISPQSLSARLKNPKSEVTVSELKASEEFFLNQKVCGMMNEFGNLLDKQIQKRSTNVKSDLTDVKDNCIPVTFYPDVYLSAGYGLETYDETKSVMMLDTALLISEKGLRINPSNCEIVNISGNSMSPEYRHGDRVIIDRGDTVLSDGQIFAIRYKGKCYVKEINLLGDKIKCISLNKEYDPFYIDEGEEFTVLGRILPRIRL